jgi:hypothetical protein
MKGESEIKTLALALGLALNLFVIWLASYGLVRLAMFIAGLPLNPGQALVASLGLMIALFGLVLIAAMGAVKR